MADTVFEPEISRSLKRLADWGRRDLSLAIECKKVETPYLPFDKVQDHQVEGLLAFEKRPYFQKISVPAAVGQTKRRFQIRTPFDFFFVQPGRAFLVVNFRFTRKPARSDLPKGLNRCFAVRPEQYVEAKNRYEAEGRASLPYEWFVENAVELERVKFRRDDDKTEYGWDLLPLLKESE